MEEKWKDSSILYMHLSVLTTEMIRYMYIYIYKKRLETNIAYT